MYECVFIQAINFLQSSEQAIIKKKKNKQND